MRRAIYHKFSRRAKVTNRAIAAYKRTEITVETDRVWTIRNSHSRRCWCGECGREVDMVGVKKAAALSGVNETLLPDCDAGRGWHWAQAPDKSPLVCLETLLRPK